MTKRDYERAAELIQGIYRRTPLDVSAGEHVEDAFAAFFAADSPRFDEARFRRACVPGANVRARPARNPTVRKIGPWPMRSVELPR